MESKLKIWIALSLFLGACNTPIKKIETQEKSFVTKQREKLRNYAFCKCLSKSNPDQIQFFVKDGSSAGYFQTSAYSLQAFSTVDSLAIVFSKIQYESHDSSHLSIMKCLDFYNGKILDSIVTALDKEIAADESKSSTE